MWLICWTSGKRPDENTHNKALFLGAALIMDYYNMIDWLQSYDLDLFKQVPNLEGENNEGWADGNRSLVVTDQRKTPDSLDEDMWIWRCTFNTFSPSSMSAWFPTFTFVLAKLIVKAFYRCEHYNCLYKQRSCRYVCRKIQYTCRLYTYWKIRNTQLRKNGKNCLTITSLVEDRRGMGNWFASLNAAHWRWQYQRTFVNNPPGLGHSSVT